MHGALALLRSVTDVRRWRVLLAAEVLHRAGGAYFSAAVAFDRGAASAAAAGAAATRSGLASVRVTHARNAGLVTTLLSAVAAAAVDADEAACHGFVEQVHVCVVFEVGVLAAAVGAAPWLPAPPPPSAAATTAAVVDGGPLCRVFDDEIVG